VKKIKREGAWSAGKANGDPGLIGLLEGRDTMGKLGYSEGGETREEVGDPLTHVFYFEHSLLQENPF